MEFIYELAVGVFLMLYAFLLTCWNKKRISFYYYDKFDPEAINRKFRLGRRIISNYILTDVFDFLQRLVMEIVWLDIILRLLGDSCGSFVISLVIAAFIRLVFISAIHLIIRYKKPRNEHA